MSDEPQVRVFLTVHSNTDGHEEVVEVVDPRAGHVRLVGHYLLVTKVTVQPVDDPVPPHQHRASCHGAIGELLCGETEGKRT